MKKLLIVLAMLVIAASLFAGGQKEEKMVILTPYIEYDHGGVNPLKYAESVVLEKYPDTVIEYKQVDLSTGSALTMDTLLASGDPPDVYYDSMVRLSRYITPDFALSLNDLAGPFIDTAPFTRGGDVLALPDKGNAQGMAINVDLMEKVGYEVPDNWTIDDFLEMAEKVKAYKDRTGEEVYATGMFAGNQSGDYLWMQWFSVFDVKLYSDDYSESTQNSGGADVWAFFRYLQEKDYIPPNSSQLVDDDYVIQWASGMFAATAFYEQWTEPYFKSVMEQGLIEKPFRYKFVSFPNNAKPCTNFSGVVVNKDTAFPEEAKLFVQAFTSKENMERAIIYKSSVSYRSDIDVTPENPRDREIVEISSKGTYDLGVTNDWFPEVRAEGYQILQQVLDGDLGPKEASIEYSERVNRIIQ